jgi:GAF domain-containing protein
MLKSFFSPPVFPGDEEKTRQSKLLFQMVTASWSLPVLAIIVSLLNPEVRRFALPAGGVVAVVLVILTAFNRIGREKIASTILVGTIVLVITFLNFNAGGEPRPLLLFSVICIMFAGLLLGGRASIIVAILLAFQHDAIVILNANGIINAQIGIPTTPAQNIVVSSLSYVLIGFTLQLAIARIQVVVNQLRASEKNLQATNRDLQNLSDSLERRVKERTAELSQQSAELEAANQQIERRAAQFEALAQVTRTIISIRDLQELLPRITTVISEKFGYYHVGIFLLDEVSAYAILIAANSDGGKRMLERKHRLKVGEQGIVGSVAATGKPRIALDVGQDAVFFNNPDLPDTHSEASLPLISKNIIIGVLDVQSTKIAAISDEDIQMLTLLADQVSLAIENARLFDDTRKALAESEMANRTSIRESWSRLPEQQNLIGYRYSVSGAAPLREPVKVADSSSGDVKGKESEASQTVVPIELRGEVIGSLIVQSPSSQKWQADQLDLIKAVAGRVALSAENARLFEETTARAEREKKVSDITGKIRQQNDPREMIRIAIEELQSALGASRVQVIPQTVKASQKGEA